MRFFDTEEGRRALQEAEQRVQQAAEDLRQLGAEAREHQRNGTSLPSAKFIILCRLYVELQRLEHWKAVGG